MQDQQIRNMYLNKIIKHINKVNNELNLYNKSSINQRGGSTSIRPNLVFTKHNDGLIDKIIKFTQDKKKLENDIRQCQNEKINLETENNKLTAKNKRLNDVYKQLIKEKSKLENDVSQLKEEVIYLKNQLQQLNTIPPTPPFEPILPNIQLDEELKRTQDELKRTQDELAKKQDELAKKTEELKITKDELGNINRELKEIQDKLADAEKRLDAARKEVSNMYTQLEYLTNKNNTLVEENRELKQQLQNTTKSNSDLQESMNNLRDANIISLKTKTNDIIRLYNDLYDDIKSKIVLIIDENIKLQNSILTLTSTSTSTSTSPNVNYKPTTQPIANFIDPNIMKALQPGRKIEDHLNDCINDARKQYNYIVNIHNDERANQLALINALG